MQAETRETEESQKSFSGVWLFISGGILLLFAAGVVGLFIAARVFGLMGYYIVPTDSMAPSIPKNVHVLVERFSYLFGTPQRGDIVVYKSDALSPGAHEKFLKRIIGLPGDVLEHKSERLLINGKVPSA